jgi:hypothetical protein
LCESRDADHKQRNLRVFLIAALHWSFQNDLTCRLKIVHDTIISTIERKNFCISFTQISILRIVIKDCNVSACFIVFLILFKSMIFMFCVRFAKNSISCRKEFLSKWKYDSTIDRNQNVSCNVLIFSLNELSWTWDLWCWSNCELFTWSNFSTKSKWDYDFALYQLNRLSRCAASNETNRFKKMMKIEIV